MKVELQIRTFFLGIRVEKPDVDKEVDPSRAPSLFDYDIVICDVDAVLGEWADKLPVKGPVKAERSYYEPTLTLNRKLSREAELLADKGGLLVCLLKPVRGFFYEYKVKYGYRSSYVTNYGWIPIEELQEKAQSLIAYGKGKRIRLSDQPSAFDQYLRMPETRWVAYFEDIKRLGIKGLCLATNDAGKPVALEVPIGKGWLVFLPISDHPKFGEILLQCAMRFIAQKRVHERPPPEWLEDFKVPSEDVLNRRLQSVSRRMATLNERLQTIRNTLLEKMEIKKLLYEGDEALENVVKKAFEEMGFTLVKKDYMDWISSSDTGEAILEVTGSEGSIDIAKLRQLLNYLLTDYQATKTEKKAILVGNHFINDPLNERGDPFTERVVMESGVHSICLLTTIELYKAICAIREKAIASKTIRKKIMETVGICKLI